MWSTLHRYQLTHWKCMTASEPLGVVQLSWLLLSKTSGLGYTASAVSDLCMGLSALLGGDRKQGLPPEDRESSNFLFLLYFGGLMLKPHEWLRCWAYIQGVPECAEKERMRSSSPATQLLHVSLLKTPPALPGNPAGQGKQPSLVSINQSVW